MDESVTSSSPRPRPLALRILIGVGYLAIVAGLIAGVLVGTEYVFKHVMRPATGTLVYDWMGLSHETGQGKAVRFFIFLLAKVLVLRTALIFIVGYVRTYFSPEHTRKILHGKHEFIGNILAALLGIVTPFCTCSAISLFLGFVEAGVPLGVTLSFLIAAPMINEIAVGLLFGMFGFRVAAMYIGCGLVIAIAAGWIIGRLDMRNLLEDWVLEIHADHSDELSDEMTVQERLRGATDNLKDVMRRIWVFVAIGIALAALMYGFVGDDSLSSILGRNAWWSVPLAVAIGVPMYGNAGGVVPIMMVLLDKGASLGTALAFMMAVVGLSLPEMIVLRKVMKLKLVLVFVGVVTVGILIVGYLFNWILGASGEGLTGW